MLSARNQLYAVPFRTLLYLYITVKEDQRRGETRPRSRLARPCGQNRYHHRAFLAHARSSTSYSKPTMLPATKARGAYWCSSGMLADRKRTM